MKNEPTFHRIKNLKVTGGFLGGIDLPFANGLNSVIGARGSGKSSTQELIRYALGILPGRDDKDPLRRRVETLIKNNLGGGRVEVVLETKDGMTYTVSRAADEEATLFSEDGVPLPIESLQSDLFRADIYSQNQIESIAETPSYQLDLLDKFKESELREIRRIIDETIRSLAANAGQIIPLISEKAQLDQELLQIDAVQERLKTLARGEGQDTEEMNRAHAEKGLRDREMKAVDHALETLIDFRQKLEGLQGHYGPQALGFFGEDMSEGANRLLTETAIKVVADGIASTEKHLRAAIRGIDTTEGRLREEKSKLESAHVLQEKKFREVVEKHQQNLAQSTERAKVAKQFNDLLFKKKRLKELDGQIKKLLTTRTRLIAKLSEERDVRFSIRHGVAEHLNKHLQPNIRVQIEQNADESAYRALLEESLRGAGINYRIVAQSLSASLSPQELGELVTKNDAANLSRRGNVNSEQARKVVAELRTPEKLFKLEIVDMDDLPKIELSDNGVYKNSAGLSTGQKCTAILPILLFESANPLLIDQPEDNLDNRYIYESVVHTVKEVKQRRQLIFVTHNPNIPVLGEAEKVIVMHSDGQIGSVGRTGDVDYCREDIINLLEGGADAFRLRGERYKAGME